ncbi:cytochrome o ubiquinol oxidase subunit III [Pseudomonas sp. NY15364]|uniref:cytochrome o ubiquinol oxidase subunit III n=1 Tax=Pseudomonas sp. NY15364 TaxID=3400353 RepID=UPI00117AD584|nr:cytochrome o ubiquinol oxidase subunit III [Pseudomonas mendocina]TRO25290.1 cytochrome o ubiquinol oxidase subunit III [Pseudomonas mendocina]TRO29173.1 cytochrome o ubiquinol oxidase subunit III [Pseudomonas mendocina]
MTAYEPHFSHDAHGHDGHEHHHDTSGIKLFGFWVYLMTDLLIFATVFATFAVLSNSFAGGPTAKEMLRPGLHLVLVETFALLFSSITYGMAMLATYRGDKGAVLRWLGITFLFGVAFISIELYEFRHLIHEGAGPQVSAYWSAFFTLVGTHGLHVSAGLLWMLVLMAQISSRGLTDTNKTRVGLLSLFWHFLDVVWICVFTVVYLLGVL